MNINNVLSHVDQNLSFLGGVSSFENEEYTDEEVKYIINAEEKSTNMLFYKKIDNFCRQILSHKKSVDKLTFAVLWGYPGAGKSSILDNVIQDYKKENANNNFLVIDKDEYRNIFSNLSNYLQGHSGECEKFSEPATKYAQNSLNISLSARRKSILSVGAYGAAKEFCENATSAIDKGYNAHCIYMSINPSIAFLSNVYRNCVLYDRIIKGEEGVYPRLASYDFFNYVKTNAVHTIKSIDNFQKRNPENTRLTVINRNYNKIYDSKDNSSKNVLATILGEENRILKTSELKLINDQMSFIRNNVTQRIKSNIFVPGDKEIAEIKKSFELIRELMIYQEFKKSQISGLVSSLGR